MGEGAEAGVGGVQRGRGHVPFWRRARRATGRRKHPRPPNLPINAAKPPASGGQRADRTPLRAHGGARMFEPGRASRRAGGPLPPVGWAASTCGETERGPGRAATEPQANSDGSKAGDTRPESGTTKTPARRQQPPPWKAARTADRPKHAKHGGPEWTPQWHGCRP